MPKLRTTNYPRPKISCTDPLVIDLMNIIHERRISYHSASEVAGLHMRTLERLVQNRGLPRYTSIVSLAGALGYKLVLEKIDDK